MFTDLRNYILAMRSTKAAQDLARARAGAALDKARAAAVLAAKRVADNEDELLRLNYYHQADFDRYQAARAAGSKEEWVNPDDFVTPLPTEEQWATLTTEQKLARGSVRF